MCEHCHQAIREANIHYWESGGYKETALVSYEQIRVEHAQEVHRQLELQDGPPDTFCESARELVEMDRDELTEFTIDRIMSEA